MSRAILSQTGGIASGDTFPVGMTTNTFEVIDVTGNSGTCSFTVTIEDNELPVITCPSDIAADTGEVVTYTVTFDDNCSGAMLTQTAGLPSGSEFPVGATTNSFEVADGVGNTVTCSFIVTVSEGEGGGNDTLPIGRVGINTNEPMAMLHVRDSSVLFNAALTYSFPGSPPPASGSGTRMMWYPSRGAFRVGRAWSSEWDQNNLGPSSFASGESTKAIGYGSTAMGYFTTASGSASIAIGNNTVASGQNAVVMGTNSNATSLGSLAAGYYCNATGQ
ncbi:MAG: HYR domain-containing protein [Saprospiraceae bacterium]|nr:HYR domain-containing protein [Candidatus Opimibacter skivensis]